MFQIKLKINVIKINPFIELHVSLKQIVIETFCLLNNNLDIELVYFSIL